MQCAINPNTIMWDRQGRIPEHMSKPVLSFMKNKVLLKEKRDFEFTGNIKYIHDEFGKFKNMYFEILIPVPLKKKWFKKIVTENMTLYLPHDSFYFIVETAETIYNCTTQ